jgi:hypothetical protein
MNTAAEHLRTDERGQLTLDEFARTAGLTAGEVRDLLDYKLLQAQQLDLRTALALRQARRLAKDFDFDLFTTGFLAGYLRQIEDLQAEVRQLRAERPARTMYAEVSFTSVEVRGA